MKLPKTKKKGKKGIMVLLVTIGFAVVGTVLLVIGYHNEVVSFLRTTGIALLLVALIPLTMFVYGLINKRIES